jgi:hypothetical protein
MFPVILVLFLVGFSLGIFALIQLIRRPKGNPPPRILTLGASTLGMLCFIAAGVLMYVSARN